jgi:hypothetical protein|tara:strand:- start:2308 stop:3327 length:1020 start_codon:yes stop_codon:yes gene_type:complete
MAVNSAFHTNNSAAITTEKNLYSDLIKEAIQIYGHDVYYMDRTLVAEDTILGEDSLSKFNMQHPIEMYMEDSEGGFAGEKELMSQFGLQNLSEATFVVNKSRFQELDRQVQIESGTDTSSSGSILLESGTIDQSSSSSVLSTVSGDENFYIIQDTAATDSDRPNEGDLIYHPILSRIFQINFVDHDDPFHQLDNNPVYKMRCRLYDYSSEVLDTGITEIDEIEDNLSVDTLGYQFTLEQSSAQNEEISIQHSVGNFGLLLEETDGDNIVGENDSSSVGENILLEHSADTGHGGWLLQEGYIVGDFDTDKTAQNELFESKGQNILDFSESNPFGDAGSKS